jgi:hypothetical protein
LEPTSAETQETKECQARTGAQELCNADADADGDADGDVRDVPMSLPSMPPPSGRSLQLSWNFSDLSNRRLGRWRVVLGELGYFFFKVVYLIMINNVIQQ